MDDHSQAEREARRRRDAGTLALGDLMGYPQPSNDRRTMAGHNFHGGF